MKLPVITLAGKASGDIEVTDAVFGAPVRKDILARMVNYQLNKRRQGSHKVKQRNEINLTGQKLYRQKGTGRARHGAAKAVQFRGGGVTFGPHLRDHDTGLPKKVRKLALKCALSAKQADGKLIVLDEATVKAPKTAELRAHLNGLGIESALIVAGDAVDANFARAAHNIPKIDVLPSQGANVYDILRRDTLVLTRAAVEHLEARLK